MLGVKGRNDRRKGERNNVSPVYTTTRKPHTRSSTNAYSGRFVGSKGSKEILGSPPPRRHTHTHIGIYYTILLYMSDFFPWRDEIYMRVFCTKLEYAANIKGAWSLKIKEGEWDEWLVKRYVERNRLEGRWSDMERGGEERERETVLRCEQNNRKKEKRINIFWKQRRTR